MQVNISTHREFERNFKHLRKKYASLLDDFKKFLASLSDNPLQGVEIDRNVRKIRMQITSKGKGKSGGARIITYNVESCSDDEYNITLLTIYDKNEISNVSDEYIRSLLNR